MASLEAVRDAIKQTLRTTITALFDVYDTVPDEVELPCVVVVPKAADFTVVMARGADQWRFDLVVLVSSTDAAIAQDSLDSFVSGAGDNSIRQCIFQNNTLGLSGTHAHISAMTDYGGQFEAAGIDHIGATLTLVVLTPGTA